MNTTELLQAVFADHETAAPEVTETWLGIQAELARASGRRRTHTLVAIGGAAAAVLAVATTTVALSGGDDPRTGGPAVAQPSATVVQSAPSTPAPSTPPPTTPESPPPGAHFPFRAGWLPPGAQFDHVNEGLGGLRLEGYTFGTVPSNIRGLTFWSEDGPLPARLRDGGTLLPTTVNGDPAVGGWSPSSRSYTLSIQRPGNLVMTVLAYGWDRATVTSFATRSAQGVEYGSFPAPSTRH